MIFDFIWINSLPLSAFAYHPPFFTGVILALVGFSKRELSLSQQCQSSEGKSHH